MYISANAQEGSMHFTIEVSRQEDGSYKAESQGLSVTDPDPIHATRTLKQQLYDATLKGELQGQGRRIA